MATKKELRLYGDLIYQHKPTIRTIIWQAMIDYFAKKNRHRRPINRDGVPLQEVVREVRDVPTMAYFAVIKKGIVEEIIVVNQFISSLLNQRGIKFVEFDPNVSPVERGMSFENNEFVVKESASEQENTIDKDSNEEN